MYGSASCVAFCRSSFLRLAVQDCYTMTGNRIVTASFFPFSKGEMLSIFSLCVFLCLDSGSASFVVFAVLFFSGSLFEKIFGSELLFLGVGVVRVCFGAVFPMFLLYSLLFRSRNCPEKILLMSGPVFWGFFVVSSFGFSPTSSPFLCLLFFSLKRDSSGSNRAHPHTHFAFLSLVLVFVPAATGFISRFGRASCFSVFLWGAILGPTRFLGFSWCSSEALFLDARRQGCFIASRACFYFSPFFCFRFAAAHLF